MCWYHYYPERDHYHCGCMRYGLCCCGKGPGPLAITCGDECFAHPMYGCYCHWYHYRSEETICCLYYLYDQVKYWNHPRRVRMDPADWPMSRRGDLEDEIIFQNVDIPLFYCDRQLKPDYSTFVEDCIDAKERYRKTVETECPLPKPLRNIVKGY